MIAIIQRVTEASVSIDGSVVGSCGHGFMILLGVARGDTERDAQLLAEKIAKLRVFEDGEGKMNLALGDIGGSVLVIPNFSLLASYRRGNRPDFFGAEVPEKASPLFDYFCEQIGRFVPLVGRGVFGAEMKVALINDGPITIHMDSEVLKAPKNAN
ncbi:MAG: D-tyrosyl-tRNA(Tyr) deacylase [Clostridia bacterium]|nr:D-tyrosyl-tRNA(Tyr) deacylase [Clostridia bacterium]